MEEVIDLCAPDPNPLPPLPLPPPQEQEQRQVIDLCWGNESVAAPARAQAAAWPRLLSSFTTEAYSLSRGIGSVLSGDVLEFTAPRKAPAAASSCVGRKKKRSRFGSSSFSDLAVRWVVRRRTGAEARECGGALLPLPPRENSCLELGKLPNPESKMLRPLLDRGFIAIAGEVLEAPHQVQYSSRFLVHLYIYALPAMFEATCPTASFGMEEWTLSQQPSFVAAAANASNFDPGVQVFAFLEWLKRFRTNKKSVAGKRQQDRAREASAAPQPQIQSLYSDACQQHVDLPLAENPKLLRCSLRPYQSQALYWMRGREQRTLMSNGSGDMLDPLWSEVHFPCGLQYYVNPYSLRLSLERPRPLPQARGGILADQMGMGKTIEVIALICASLEAAERGTKDSEGAIPPKSSKHSKAIGVAGEGEGEAEAEASNGITLVICTMSLLSQWRDEIERHSGLRVLCYYGSQRLNSASEFSDVDVVLSTYGTVSAEFRNGEDEVPSPLFACTWQRCVLDEAHYIKNRTTSTAKAVFRLQAIARWCLTGTPVQNSLSDLFSLLHFLREQPWGSYSWWHQMIEQPFDNGDGRVMQRLQAVLQPLLLRRTKEATDQHGVPLLKLPERDDRVVPVLLSAVETRMYARLFSRSKTQFDGFVSSGVALKRYANCLQMLLRLRLLASHPFLLLPTKARAGATASADLATLADRLRASVQQDVDDDGSSDVLDLAGDTEADVRSECPICLETTPEPLQMRCGHQMCCDCTFSLFNSEGFALCPLCRSSIYRADVIADQNLLLRDVSDAAAASTTILYSQDDFIANWSDSAKTRQLIACLREFEVSDPGSKTVVFSEFTSMLDLCEISLRKHGFTAVRLDGSLSQRQRVIVLSEFESRDDVAVLLCSLRVGGVGLNLTCASNVVLLSIWWNPAVDEQAIDRVHRIGQSRRVRIRRFVVQDTVEARILELQEKKRKLADGALQQQLAPHRDDDKDDKARERLNNLVSLFRAF